MAVHRSTAVLGHTLVKFLLVLGCLLVPPIGCAFAADVDCAQLAPGDCGFGNYFLNVKGGVLTNLSELNPDWTGT